MGQTTMVERLYSVSNRVLSLTLIASFVSFAIESRSVAEDAKNRDGANVRIATFDSESGETFFAASIQPSADKTLMKAVSESPADVVIIIDTSASQSGEFRNDSIEAARRVAKQLRPQDKVLVYTADVNATKIDEDFADAKSVDDSIDAIKRRLPLGNTNLVSVIDDVRPSLVGRPQNHTRSIVYIGDGSSADSVDDNALSMLVDALRSDKISIHSIGIGPSVNIPLLAIFANHTGGLVTAAGENFSVSDIASEVGAAAINSPIWIQSSQWFDGIKTVGQHPPLRMERDSIVLGRFSGQSRSGKVEWNGQTSASSIRIRSEGTIEPSSSDFGFLVSLVHSADRDNGLRLATASSPVMRMLAQSITAQSEELIKASKMALQQGNKRGAKVIAEMAIEADPNNSEAKVLREAAAKRLVMQNEDSLDDIFGGGDDAAATAETPAAETPAEKPLGDAPAADAAASADDALFSDSAFDDSEAVPAEMPQPTTEAQAAPLAEPAPPVQPAPATSAPAPMDGQEPLEFGFGVEDANATEPPGELLGEALQERSAAEGRLRAEVRAALRDTSRRMRVDPTGVSGSLKSLLARIESMPDINPQLRRELASQVRSAIQIGAGREAEYAEAQATLEQVKAAADSQSRLLAETFRREATLDTLSAQMNALIDEGKYEQADGEVSLEFAKIAGDTITADSVEGRHITDVPLMLQTYARDRRYREMRERNFVDAFSLVMKSNIPFVDEPPLQYPDADVWIRMSRRRLERYGSIELVGNNESERRIEAALDDTTSNTFEDMPLQEAIETISRMHEIPIRIDATALEESGLNPEDVVNVSLSNVSLRSFLRIMLRDFGGLTYMIKDEVMQITTSEIAGENLVTKVYPVGDLVVPIVSLGGGGGGMGGGGMGGGGMGGGGMGGGGMGGGGMGGGGMGGGGMGGGGMFAVPDDVPADTKTSVIVPAKDNTIKTDVTTDLSKSTDVVMSELLKVTPSEGESHADAWLHFFENAKPDSAEAIKKFDASVARTVRFHSARAAKLHKSGDTSGATDSFTTARDVLAAAIVTGHVQPWMYHAYAIALQATQAPAVEVERALLSAVDFAETPDDLLNVASRLESIQSYSAAIQLCRNVSSMDPLRREPYVMGMRLAQKTDNTDDLTWAVSGVLGHAWPQRFESIVEEAKLLAKATHARLTEEGKSEKANEFNATLKTVTSHDVVVRVSWTGDADLDIAVEEPSGTVCAADNISSAGGGTYLGDQYPGSLKDQKGVISESYICPSGFTGVYRILVRRVWGNVTTGMASVEVLTDIGRPTQRLIQKQVPLTEKDVLVNFEVKEGKRKDEIGHAQLAHLQDVARDIRNDFVLGQFADPNQPDPAQVFQSLFQQSQLASGGGNTGGAGFNPFVPRGAVGFRPEITQLPEGASLSTLAIISADRRYVRISPVPFFSQIGDVTTFNFVTGEEGGGGGGGGLGGLGGGGGGGGLGGGGFGN